jgi:hypothetical protein
MALSNVPKNTAIEGVHSLPRVKKEGEKSDDLDLEFNLEEGLLGRVKQQPKSSYFSCVENNLSGSVATLKNQATVIYNSEAFVLFSSAIFGATYFFAAVAGKESIERLMPVEADSVSTVLYSLSALSSLSHMVSYREISYKMSPVPVNLTSAALFAVSLLPALTFGLASLDGCEYFQLDKALSYSIAGGLTLFRARWIFDGLLKVTSHNKDSNQFGNPFREIYEFCFPPNEVPAEFRLTERQSSSAHYSRLAKFAVNNWVILSTICLSMCETDSINLGIKKIANAFQLNHSDALSVVAFVGAIIGISSSFPSSIMWMKKIWDGVLGGEFKSHEPMRSRISLLGSVFWSASVSLGPIGVIASPSTLEHGPMLSQLFGTETAGQRNANEAFRIAALMSVYFVFVTYVHYKTLYGLMPKK